MEIAVLSDTHLRLEKEGLPEALVDNLKKVDLIVHCGDFEEFFVLEKLKAYGEVRAVYGNMDSKEIKDKLPRKEIIEAMGFKIGIIHGYGGREGIEERIKLEFRDTKIDAILYGHTHVARENRKELIFFNPGSPMDKKYAPFNSFGMLYLEAGEKIKAEIIRI